MISFLSKIADRLFAVGGAFVFCQIPELIRQYMALLSGHLSESKSQIALIGQNAAASGKTIPEFIQKFMQQSDADFVREGKMLQSLVARHDELSTGYIAVSEASVWTKPFVFFSHVDLSIFHETTEQFVPKLAFSFETMAYAAVGIGFGVLVYRALARGVSLVFTTKTHGQDVAKS